MAHVLEKYDNHRLSYFRLCPLKWWWRHEEHYIQTGDRKAPALEYGTYIHKALDVLYDTKDLAAAKLDWLNQYGPVFEELDPTEPQTEKHNVDVGWTMLDGYWEYWHESIEAMELLGVEQYFAMDMEMDEEDECPVCDGTGWVEEKLTRTSTYDKCVYCSGKGSYRGPIYCGCVDKVFKDTRSGQIVGMDHKTTSMLTGALINSFKISPQFRGYIYWLTRKSEWAETCGEYFYFDLLLKTKTSKYNDDNMPFYRDTVLAQDEFLDEWWDDTRTQIAEARAMRTWARNCNRLPRQNGDACNNWNRICTYYDLCSMPRPTRPTLAADLYEVNEWDPLHRDDED